MADVTFDKDKLQATVTMKDANCTLDKKAANKALVAKGDRFKVSTFKEKK